MNVNNNLQAVISDKSIEEYADQAAKLCPPEKRESCKTVLKVLLHLIGLGVGMFFGVVACNGSIT